MALRVTKEDRQEIKDEFLFVNEAEINKYAKTILEYWNSQRTTLSKRKIVDPIFENYDKVETIAGNILFTLSTIENGNKPLQSIAGMLVGFLSISDLKEDRIDAMLVAMELIMVSDKYVNFNWSNNGYPMINNLISQEDLMMKNIYLPLDKPSYQHTELGSYNWKMDQSSDAIEALDILNHTALRTRLLKEKPEIVPEPDDFSKEGNKQRELVNKQLAREYLCKEYDGKPIYFNWSPDYRGRMYQVGQ